MLARSQFHSVARGYAIAAMARVTDIRHAKLLLLIAQHGTIQKLADALGKSHSQISQLRNQSAHSTTGRVRVIGDDLAREIEAKLRLGDGWMDTPEIHPHNDANPLEGESLELQMTDWAMLQAFRDMPTAKREEMLERAQAESKQFRELAVEALTRFTTTGKVTPVAPDIQAKPSDPPVARVFRNGRSITAKPIKPHNQKRST